MDIEVAKKLAEIYQKKLRSSKNRGGYQAVREAIEKTLEEAGIMPDQRARATSEIISHKTLRKKRI